MLTHSDNILARAIFQERLQQAEQRRLVQSCASKQTSMLAKTTEQIGNMLIAAGERLQRAGTLEASAAQPTVMDHS